MNPREDRKKIARALTDAAFFFLKQKYPRRTIAIFPEVAVASDLRVDILCLSHDDEVTVLEIKSCKDDFRLDKKWQKYLAYCNFFYFLVEDGVIDPKDLPEGTGLIYLVRQNNGKKSYNIVRESRRFRGIGLTNKWFRTIYKRLAFRVSSEDGFSISGDI